MSELEKLVAAFFAGIATLSPVIIAWLRAKRTQAQWSGEERRQGAQDKHSLRRVEERVSKMAADLATMAADLRNVFAQLTRIAAQTDQVPAILQRLDRAERDLTEYHERLHEVEEAVVFIGPDRERLAHIEADIRVIKDKLLVGTVPPSK